MRSTIERGDPLFAARDPNVLASTASESVVKTKSESQIPLSSWNEQQPRTVRLVMGASSSDYSEWNIDEEWLWKMEQGDLLFSHSTRTDSLLKTIRRILTHVVRIQIILAQGE